MRPFVELLWTLAAIHGVGIYAWQWMVKRAVIVCGRICM